MASAATKAHCPECGAPVKSGDKQCWMCFRLLEWDRGTVKVAAASPFAERPDPLPRTQYRTNPWAVAGVVLAALAMVPAACIAFFVTCLVTIDADPKGNWAMPAACGAGFVVFVGFGVLIGMLSKRVTRQVT